MFKFCSATTKLAFGGADRAGTSRTPEMKPARGHAVVVGASIAGLAAAKVLCSHFASVTIIERDSLASRDPLLTTVDPESRKGVPQGNHAHVLLSSGCRAIEELFPGVLAEMREQGARSGDVAADVLWYDFGDWTPRSPIGIAAITVSRPCLERAIRRNVRKLENLTFLENHDALEPLFDSLSQRVTGIRAKDRTSGVITSLNTDLIVDASGRGTASLKWLASWGFGHVPESSVKVDLGYATATFARKPGDCDDANGLLITARPPVDRRAGVMLRVEGERWIVTLGGMLRDYPPTDLAGFRAFARTLATSDLFDQIKDREPLTPIHQHRFSGSIHRHYERLTHFPAGYLITGDAVCSFNPLYGQGMSVAMLEAQALDQCLANGDARLAKRFFVRSAKIVANPWAIVTGADMIYPEVEGVRPPGFAWITRYMERVHLAMLNDLNVLRRFLEVVHMLRPPSALLAPSIVWRVLRPKKVRPVALAHRTNACSNR